MENIINIESLTICFANLLARVGCNVEGIADFQNAADVYRCFRDECGRKSLAQKLLLNEQEFSVFDTIIKSSSHYFSTKSATSIEETNTNIAYFRFLFWIETIGQRIPEISLPDEIEAVISRNMGQKQLRSLELVIRSLINEKFGDQQTLEQELFKIFKDPIVERWKKSADPGNILSGASFGELACLFVSKREFPSYMKFYEHTPFLKFLNNRKKTAQSFLEDIRRIRNTYAHYRNVTGLQLNLIDSYYEELIQPIQNAFEEGKTSVDPSSVIEVSDEDLDLYFTRLSKDIVLVRDDIAELKESLESSIAEVKDDTQSIKKISQRVSKRTAYIAAGIFILIAGSLYGLYLTTDVRDSTVEIVTTNREIAEGISLLGKDGGIIANPEKAEDFYHNARLYEQNGDYLNARKSYARYFSFNLHYLDPHLRYQTFLKVQEGMSGAREIYAEMKRMYDNDIVTFAAIKLSPENKKLDGLKKFIADHPDFAPAYYVLSQEYSEDRLGSQSLADKKQEKDGLEKFIQADEEGNFLKYFLDHERAAEWLDDARDRLASLAILGEEVLETPVLFSSQRSNVGWSVDLSIGEAARKIEYRTDENQPYVDNGVWDYLDERTGARIPRSQIKLPKGFKRGTLYVRYEDVQNKTKGPFEFWFDENEQIVVYQKMQLMLKQDRWVDFKGSRQDKQKYYPRIMIADYPCAIARLRYGWNGQEPDQDFIMPICNMACPNCDGGLNFREYRAGKLEMPKDVKNISLDIENILLRLDFRDGTSARVIINNPYFVGKSD